MKAADNPERVEYDALIKNSTPLGLPYDSLFTPDIIRGYSYSTPSELPFVHIDYQCAMRTKK
ncbi:MAG: hypothetical protein KF852_20260 [Saprospiraceae bacterium]|nr:hypothetical protein [Saprospiraceae bacterium]